MKNEKSGLAQYDENIEEAAKQLTHLYAGREMINDVIDAIDALEADGYEAHPNAVANYIDENGGGNSFTIYHYEAMERFEEYPGGYVGALEDLENIFGHTLYDYLKRSDPCKTAALLYHHQICENMYFLVDLVAELEG